jgi:hypothetical protein
MREVVAACSAGYFENVPVLGMHTDADPRACFMRFVRCVRALLVR